MADRPRILIVDDELGPRESLRMILKPSYEVFTADNGASALELIARDSFDLITLDLKMPGLSGTEVLERIRQLKPDVMVVIVTGYGTFKSVVEAIQFNVFDYVSKPFNVPEIVSLVKRCLEVSHIKCGIQTLFREIANMPELDSPGLHQSAIIQKIRELLGDEEAPALTGKGLDRLELIRLISNGVERRDPWTIGHSERVSRYADAMAQKLGFPESARRELRMAAYLHDLGKLGLSSRVVNGNGKLSSTDWAILKRHPILSTELSEPLALLPELIGAIRHHHERFDGTGYPEGLRGSDIPIFAQILSLVDVYDSLTSKRPNWEPMTPGEAEAEIRKCAGSYFDPDLARAFSSRRKERKVLRRRIKSVRDTRRELS